MTWLKTLVEEKLRTMHEAGFSPLLTFDFDHVLAAVTMVEDAIDREQAGTREETGKARKAARTAGTDPNQSFLDNPVFAHLGVELFNSALTFPLILRRAMLIAISSHVEHVLRQWCRWLHQEWSLSKPLGKKAHNESELQNCLRYLQVEAGLVGLSYDQWPEWPLIDGYRVARNSLAHDGGIVDEGDEPRIAALAHVVVDKSGILAAEPVIVLDKGACEAALDVAKKFFERIGEVCQRDPRAERKAASAPSE